MKRTARRPLAREAVPTRNALVFGLALTVASFCWLWRTTNLLSGLLALATVAFYVFVYTLLLKRRTSQNVVWGGAAGCMPVMIGWSAVTGTIGWPALVMFAVIFFWTPPHVGAGDAVQGRLQGGRRSDAAGRRHRATGDQADPDLHLADGAGDPGAGARRRLAVRRGRGFRGRVVPRDGPPAVLRRAPANRSSRCGCSCSRTTTWPSFSARWQSTRRSGCLSCSDRQGSKTIEPVVLRPCRSSCARAASASG